MSTADQREPTNDELWAQPPTINTPVAGHGLAPIPQAPAPAPLPVPIAPPSHPVQDRTVFVLAIVSFALGIPLTAISSSNSGIIGLLVVWTGIVLVNFFYARSRRH
ncbi:MAG TPA: hypothetical protein VGK18_03710 [Propionicimonas sp.]|jgi:hypothetical protein|uniref:hypothetical protein n=1 Tax=Propionicimonas sp. TaxID=1955623 RepID=UPI002F3E377B